VRAAPAAAAAPPAVALEPRAGGLIAACFQAMASPCELLLTSEDAASALALGRLVAGEAWRVERKYSRYRSDSVLARIHQSRGNAVSLDAETVALIDFAQQCYLLSAGMFDITSGILRRAWRFDGSDRLPSADQVAELLPLMGFDKLDWQPPRLTVPQGMELDFGGIGKEYAIDRAFELLICRYAGPFLLNFGGDLRTNKPPSSGPWQVGIERPDEHGTAAMVLQVERGALATSGDARRFLLKDGIRYGHILNPFTGWPVTDAPRSVTVAASSCTEAGMLSTMALLRGADAEAFLDAQGVSFWIQR
jgi:thiamine biosynthesis lipoprotein